MTTTTVESGDSIQGAIDDAENGDTIHVESGTFGESLVIDVDDLTLEAVGEEPTILDGTQASGSTGIVVTADNVTIDGLEVREFDEHGISVQDASDVTIDGVTAADNGWAGVLFENAEGGTVQDSTVTGNGLALEDDEPVPGIRFDDSPNGEISHNDATDNARQGINVMGGSAGTLVEHNTASGNERSGIYVQDTNAVTIEENTAEDNGFRGIHVEGSDEGTDEKRVLTGIEIRGNEIADNSQSDLTSETYSGIFVQSVDGALVEDNVLERNLRAIVAEETIDVELRGNDISNPRVQTTHELQAIDSRNVVIEDNTLTDVGMGILVSEDGFDLQAIKPFDSSNAEIRGNDITNVQNGAAIQLGFSEDGATYNGSANAVIEDNVIKNTSSSAIVLAGLSSETVIENNEVTNGGPSGVLITRGGAVDSVDPETFFDTTDVTITNNRLNESNVGVRLQATTRVTVEGNILARNDVGISSSSNQTETVLQYNEITDSADAGIRFFGSAGDLHAYGNYIEGGDGNGIQVGSAGGGTFENNTITDVGRFGVVFYDDAWTGPGDARSSGSAFDDQRNEGSVIDNEITNAGVDGVRVDFGTGIEISDNEISDSAEHGVRLAYRSATDDNVAEDFFRAAEDTTVSGNEIAGSGEIGLYVDTIAAPITPDGRGGGTGSAPDPDNEFPTGVFVTDNRFESNGNGTVFTPYVSGIEIETNEYVDHETDLVLERVSDVELFDNTLEAGISVEGDDLEHFAHDVDNNVFEDDSPLFYATGESGTTAPTDARQAFVVDSTGVTVDGLESEGMPIGVLVAESDDVAVTGATVTEAGADGDRGIAVIGGTDIDITETTVDGYATGVEFDGVGDATFGGGDVVDSTGDGEGTGGIVATDSTNVTIATTEFAGHASHAIRFDEVEMGTIEANEVSSSERGIWVWNSGAVDVSANDVQNITDRGIDTTTTGVSLDFETATVIDSNLVADGDAGGIRGFGAEAVTNNTVRDNDGTGISADGVIAGNHVEGSGGNGGIVSGADDAEIRNNTVLGNEGIYGIRVSTATSVIVERNDVEDNDGIGIQLNSVSDAVVEENTVANNDEDGIDLNGVSDVEMFGNDVSAHTDFVGISSAAGVTVDADGAVTIESNTIEDNRDGLRIESAGSGDITVASNWILNNNNGVLIEPDADHITVTENDIAGNSVYGLRYDGDASTLEATNNWWGAESGPSTTGNDEPFVDAEDTDVVADGDGDEIHADSGPIQFAPFATAPQSDGDDPEESDGTITGTIVDEDDNPIAGVELTVIEQVDLNEPATEPDGFTTVIVTDDSGEFSVDVPSGAYKFDPIAATGFADGYRQNVEVQSAEVTTLDPITLESTPVLTGTVTDAETDEPIAGVEIESRFYASDPLYTATTGPDGDYAINIPEQGSQTPQVVFSAEGYESKQIDGAETDLEESTAIDIELTPIPDPGTISGQVTMQETGEAVANVFVNAGDQSGVTGEDGSYELTLQPGTYTVSTFSEDPSLGTVTEENVVVEEGETTTLDLEIFELGTLTGTVTDGDDPVAGIPVQVIDMETGEPIASDSPVAPRVIDSDTTSGEVEMEPIELGPVTNENGEYAIDVSPGTYEVSVFAEEWIAAPVTETVAEGETATVDLEVEPLPDPEDVELAVEIRTDESTVDVADGEEITVVAEIANTGDVAAAKFTALGVVEAGVLDGDELPTDVDTLYDESSLLPRVLGPGDTLTETFSFESDLAYDGAEAVVVTGIPDGQDPVAFDTAALSVSPVDDGPAPDPVPELDVLEATVIPTQLETGEEATIEATVENVGEVEGELTVPLEVNGQTVETAMHTLEAGESTDVTFTWTFETAGEFQIGVGGVDAGTVTVIEDADVLIYGADVNQSAILLGETITITGDLLNNGGPGTYDVDLNIDGERVENTTVEVGPGATPGAVEFEWTPTEADLPADEDEMNATISLNGFVVETVFVENQYSDIHVIAASVSEDEVVQDEEVYAIGSIYQAGTTEGPEVVDLTATNTETNKSEVVDTQEITLEPGFYHLGALNLSFVPDEAGTYDLELGDRHAGTVEVEEAESDLQVIAASVSDVEAVEDDELYAVGSVYQAGNIDGPETVELTATNTETNKSEVVGTQEITLEPGFYHLGALNISFVPDEAGTYDLELGDRHAGTIEVEPAESDIQVIAASVSDVDAVEGDELYAVGSIYQNGTIDGPEEIELTATDVESGETNELGSQNVTLEPGFYHLGALNVSFAAEPGTYDLELGDRHAGTIEVEPAESDIQVIAASVSDVEAIEGDDLYVTGSIYQAGNVDGPEEIELTATDVESGETNELGSQNVTLEPGFYHLGALNVSFVPDEAGTYDLELGDRHAGTIEVEKAYSDVQVIAASVSEVEVTQGDELYATGSIYQAGNVDGPEEVELTATNVENGEKDVLGSQNVTLEPGFYHLGALNISFTPDKPGDYELALGDREIGTITVDEIVTDIRVIGASVSAVDTLEGEPVHVTGSIYQNGSDEATETIDLTATNTETGENEVVGSQEVTLEPGFYHLGALNISFVPDEPGTYDLELGDLDAGTVDVEEAYSDVQVIAAGVSEVELVEGEELFVTGSIYQNGTVDDSETINLTATHVDTGEREVVGSQAVTLEPGFYHLGALNVSFAPDEPGTYDLELGDRAAGTVEVVPAESDIQVIAAGVSEIELAEGEQTSVTGSIYQNGTIDGPEEIELTATNTETGDTAVVGTQEVTLEPGFYHLGAINITFEPDEAGTYDLELGDTDAGTVDVDPAESDIQVIAASTSQIELVEGEHAYVVGSVYQGGNVEGTEEISLNATHQETGETEAIGSQEVTLAPGFYHLGAINITSEFNQAGTYDLELGDRNAGTIDVTESTVEASIVDVAGHSVSFDPEIETEQVHASDDVPVTVEIDADLDLETVNVLVSSLETNYVRSFEASHDEGETWTATVSPASVEDDGRYEVSVVAVDRVGSVGMDAADNPLVIDRDAPRLSATLEDVDGEGATVVVESDTPLAEPPEVESVFTAPDNSTESGSVAMLPVSGSDTHFTGTFATGETGSYEITSVGTDRAGNEGTDTASVTVDTRFTLGDGVIEIDDTGTTIAFEVADEADEAILTQELFASLSETTANANLDDGQLGASFITADLDNLLDYYLEEGTVESASISMAIDEQELPGSASADEVELHYYDDASGSWDPVAGSTVTLIDDDPFVTASVTGFSTYGAFVPDTEPPVIGDRSPADGSTLDADLEETTVRFEYADDRSGIDVGTVTMEVDGEDVTASDDTDITSSAAEHTLTLEPGTSYSATITVADTTGNTATADTGFSVAESDSGGSESGGGSFPVPTDPTTDVPEIPTGTNATDTARTTLETHSKTGGSTATFETDDGIREITFDEAADGEVVVRTLDGVPEAAETPSGTVLSVVQIAVPDSLTDSPATITTAVPTAQLEEAGATSDGLVISRLDSDSGEWDSLETTVDKETTDSVVINADTPGFSVFVVTADATDSAADDKSGKESEPADETTADGELGEEPEPADERTDELDDEMPGFGVTISLVVILCLVVAARRRASTDRQ
ncbi:right-handed parallel beta-helix repeat-containing protein [Natronorubrum bangense]|uniref:right-handed parallel beta-helix repeat-containing protein n=1 Tax=Natronorubrum bangense TaxID=61858 RepID=UPI00197BF5B5|nr:right-handed parallel beta-helix repeat-containing protein [Natronorubrum bangense]